jgi:uncharacterized protein (TIGR02246 family)
LQRIVRAEVDLIEKWLPRGYELPAIGVLPDLSEPQAKAATGTHGADKETKPRDDGAGGEGTRIFSATSERSMPRNAQAVVKLYTDDAVVMAPNNPPAVGRDTVRAVYEGIFKAVKLDLKFEIDEAKPLSAQWAYVRSRSKFTVKVLGTDLPLQPDANQELFLLQKAADGQWRIARYSFSSTNPAKK